MSSQSPWDLLRCGNADQGLTMIRERYRLAPSPSNIMALGVSYMWVGDYKAASQHFQYSIQTDKTPGEGYFGFTGAAEWCLENYSTAVQHWRAGLKAPYAAGGVCIHSPMLLLLASILRPGLFPRREAEELLTQKAKDPRLKFWPGTLGQFIAGQIHEAALEASWLGNIARNVRGVMPQAKWLTEFYKVVLTLGRGEME